jgi:hypothetical protein
MAGSQESFVKKTNDHEQSKLHKDALSSRTSPIYPEKQQDVSNNVA